MGYIPPPSMVSGGTAEIARRPAQYRASRDACNNPRGGMTGRPLLPATQGVGRNGGIEAENVGPPGRGTGQPSWRLGYGTLGAFG